MTLQGEPNGRHAIEVSDDLKAWTLLRSEMLGADGTPRFLAGTAIGASQLFYRAVRTSLP